jgi:menaquinone-specific isochorismate synthase
VTPTTTAADLVAHTVRVEGDVDLAAVAGDDGLLWEHDGDGLAGRGVALRLPLPAGLAGEQTDRRVATALAAIDTTTATAPSVAGTGPVAVCALPFEPAAPAVAIVPRVTVRRLADGQAWVTTVGPLHESVPAVVPFAADAGAAAGESRRPPDAFTLTPTGSHDDFCERVAAATKAIAAGTFEKVVLARQVVVTANRPILTADVVRRLRALYPSCMVFSIDGFVGASPELLISRRGQRVRSHPLAGTFGRSGDARADAALAAALTASAKDRWEHQLVVDSVAAALAARCAELAVPGQPEILPLRNVLHLGTEITGRLADSACTALDLVAALHPTPAVAGTPTAAAMAHLRAVENFERGRYAGAVGWVDGRGDGDWAIGIRSAELDGTRARLFAGVGIVHGSEPDAELVETQLKLQALLAAVVRP